MSLMNPQPPLNVGIDSVPLESETPKENEWIRIARQIYEGSTDYLDANLRFQWEKSISLFNGKHPPGSKYNTTAYEKRAKFFRPKTRIAVRNLQAAMSVAFFTNEDVVSIEPANPNDQMQSAAAVVAQSIMQYRLTNTIPWFQTMVAALQDAMVQGVCISHQYWDFHEKKESYVEVDQNNDPLNDEEGNPLIHEQLTAIKDFPVIELISPENIRIDPAADWSDPIKSSPYIVHLIPMYLQDVREKIKSGEWLDVTDEELLSTSDDSEQDNTTRLVRDEPRMDPKENESEFGEIKDFRIIWVHKNIVKRDGVDQCFFTAGIEIMLTDPKPLREMYPWLMEEERPYVMGAVNLEAHKLYPSGTVELTQELQAAANDDVRVIDTKDVTGSAYAEQDRINMDFDELQGNFSTSTIQGARALNETVGGMNLLAGESSTIAEYTLRTFADTWVQKVLKQLLRLEQYYETDPVVLAVAGTQAANRFKFNADEMLDELLRQDVLLKVNVGLNATDPLKKVQNLLFGVQTLAAFPGVAERINLPELTKEIFGQLGYKDGSRFVAWEEGGDGRIEQLEMQLQELQQMIQIDQQKTEGKIKIQEVKNQGGAQVAQIRSQSDIETEMIRQESDIKEAEIRHQDAVTRRGELLLQRDALLNESDDKQVDRELELQAGGKSGIIERDRYNKIPYAVG